MADAQIRCTWPGEDPIYVAYHDDEWGVPEYDDRALFEKLVLDGFQAGLSWITILRKRDAFRKAFDGFKPDIIVHYGPEKVEKLMNNAGIVRNRAKIEGTIANARGYLEFMEQDGFAHYLWNFMDGAPLQSSLGTMKDMQAQTDLSKTISRDLKARGFKFCGPTITYAFMQAVGMVNDHLTACFRHKECAEMASSSPFGNVK